MRLAKPMKGLNATIQPLFLYLFNLFNQSTQSTYLTTQPILPINENLLFTDRRLESRKCIILADGIYKDLNAF
jgi:hypothetical protein